MAGSRPKQIDFLQRFMAAPFVPTSSGILTTPIGGELFCRFTALLGQFNLQKLVSSLRKNCLVKKHDASSLHGLVRHLQDKSLCALNFCSKMLHTPNDTLLVSVEDLLDKSILARRLFSIIRQVKGGSNST